MSHYLSRPFQTFPVSLPFTTTQQPSIIAFSQAKTPSFDMRYANLMYLSSCSLSYLPRSGAIRPPYHQSPPASLPIPFPRQVSLPPYSGKNTASSIAL